MTGARVTAAHYKRLTHTPQAAWDPLDGLDGERGSLYYARS